jgi:tRNA-dihydrouridine synthase
MGEAEYDTIRAVKRQRGIPVIANGDIDHAGRRPASCSTTPAPMV